MLAAVFNGSGKGIEIKNTSDPKIECDEILVKVMACGLCHTDLHYLEHGVPTFKEPPIILGHEAAGIVEEAGSSCRRVPKGTHVLVPSVLPCGICYNCASGRGNICLSMKMPGNHIDGAFAQYIKIKEWQAFELPDSMDLAEASTIADAVSTAYHAVVNRAQVKPGQSVLVVGCGGVGINVIQIAKLAGALITAVDKDKNKLKLAEEFGAAKTFWTGDEIATGKLKNSQDVAFECVGNPAAINLAHSTIKVGGTLMIVGYSGQRAEMAVNKIMFMEQQVIGSLGCRFSSFADVIRLASKGKINLKSLVSNRFGLKQIGSAVEELKKGSGLRQVVEPWQ
ncbi:MAG: zinc-binding dehydrogenase [Planctomycetes bacterium]|nr:zinc-binding dehydrogenase [Planctomycetota bacterium]